jgi:CubicO group peptidase (beta-lactamase class C family)
MSDRIKRSAIICLTVLLVGHFLIETTGHHYLYKTISMTLLEGRLGPSIQEYRAMPSREISAWHPQPWPRSTRAEANRLTESETDYHAQNQSVSFLVIHHDSIIYESYWDGFNADSISNSFSMSKSIIGLLTGIAIDEGKIENVDKPVYWYMPQYREGLGEELTIKHLLTMSSGIDFDEHYINPFAFPAKANYGDNLELLLCDYSVTEKPGERFHYKSGNTQLLGHIISDVMRTSLSDMATKHVWSKIGAEKFALWSLDHEDGMEKAFCCINATARDFARIGKLYKDHGKWNGTVVVDSTYVAASIMPSGTQNLDGTVCNTYGYQWWLGHHAQSDFFFMRGIKGQYVLVSPQHDLVVVRLGRKRDVGSGEHPHPDDVYTYLEMGKRMIEE